MIYMVDHIFSDAASEPEWHAWYAEYALRLLAVPGIYSAQRFKAIGHTPPRYLAMYSIESEAVYSSEPYRNMGGGGSQSARFHHAYDVWTRNLFEGADRAPKLSADQKLLVWDRPQPETGGALTSRAVWLHAVGLHRTTPYRAVVVLAAAEAVPLAQPTGSFLYEPFTDYMEADSRS
jgi:hypothetical protein